MNRYDALIVMRLADMLRGRPAQDNSRLCSFCGEPVGISPFGQKALREYPKAEIMCIVCAEKPVAVKRDINRLAAPFAEIAQEVRDSTPVAKQ